MPIDHEPLEPKVLEALARNRKIEAIKILREKRRIGLKEAKDAIDAYLDEHSDFAGGVHRASTSGLIPLLVVVSLLGLVAYLLLTD